MNMLMVPRDTERRDVGHSEAGAGDRISDWVRMFSLLLIFGGLIVFSASMVCFVLAIVFASDLLLGVSAGVLGLSVGQFLAFLVIKDY